MSVPQRPVVAGVDASPEAARAVAFAIEEAGLRGAPLRLVHALSWPAADLTTAAGRLAGAARRTAEDLLAETAAGAEAALGPGRVGWEVRDGHPVEVLRAEGAGAQLVVVGSRGSGGLSGLLLGSTAGGVVLDAPCPVVVLPDETAVRARDRRSVVVGVEGRPGDEEVLAVAFTEAATRGTDLVAVHAWQDAVLDTAFQSLGPLADWAGVLDAEERLLAEALAGWHDKDPAVPVREIVVRDRTARALVAAALGARLLVVGHRRHRLARLGSTTYGVLHRAGCPVVVVPLAPAAQGGSR
ncbi:universal stress protein [Geodermatophilus sp. SYSU D00758]